MRRLWPILGIFALISLGLLSGTVFAGSLTFNTANLGPSTFGNLPNLLPSAIVGTGINLFLGLAGVMAFLYLLWGGIQWITGGADKDAVEKARKKISAALIGLAIVFSAYALIFIVQALFNIQIIQIDLYPIGQSRPAAPVCGTCGGGLCCTPHYCIAATGTCI